MTIQQGWTRTKITGYKRTRNKIFIKRVGRHRTQTQLVNSWTDSNWKYIFLFFLIPYYHTLRIGHGKTFLLFYIFIINFLKTKFLFTWPWFRLALLNPARKFEVLFPGEPTKMLEKLSRWKGALPVKLKIHSIKIY